MVLPTTYLSTLALLIVSLICWGSWANAMKLTGDRWRFELFYFDYSFGVLLASILAAFIFGMAGSDMNFQDRMLVAGHLKQVYAVLGGVVFNLANMLLVAAIDLAGLAVAFPVGIGLALVIGVVWNYAIEPRGNPWFLFIGVLLVIAAIVVDARAHFARDKAKGTQRRHRTARRGIVISIVSGVLMGAFYPIVEKGMGGELGLGPYAAALLFSLGVFGSTFVFNLFFMNVPVSGPPVKWKSYFLGQPRWHFLGIAGGAVWAVGAITNFVAASAPPEVNVGPAISLAIGQCATLASVLWGLLWKEFAGTAPKVRILIIAMLLLFAGGLVLLSLAPIVT